jgi:hypothetical protein
MGPGPEPGERGLIAATRTWVCLRALRRSGSDISSAINAAARASTLARRAFGSLSSLYFSVVISLSYLSRTRLPSERSFIILRKCRIFTFHRIPRQRR